MIFHVRLYGLVLPFESLLSTFPTIVIRLHHHDVSSHCRKYRHSSYTNTSRAVHHIGCDAWFVLKLW
jgi:hypothetical protein